MVANCHYREPAGRLSLNHLPNCAPNLISPEANTKTFKSLLKRTFKPKWASPVACFLASSRLVCLSHKDTLPEHCSHLVLSAHNSQKADMQVAARKHSTHNTPLQIPLQPLWVLGQNQHSCSTLSQLYVILPYRKVKLVLLSSCNCFQWHPAPKS